MCCRLHLSTSASRVNNTKFGIKHANIGHQTFDPPVTRTFALEVSCLLLKCKGESFKTRDKTCLLVKLVLVDSYAWEGSPNTYPITPRFSSRVFTNIHRTLRNSQWHHLFSSSFCEFLLYITEGNSAFQGRLSAVRLFQWVKLLTSVHEFFFERLRG